MGRNDRPEHTAPPEIFYNEDEARKYTENTRIVAVQRTLTERALELLALPNDGTPKLLLDLGCGSCLSGEALTDQGHVWVGTDISSSMLDVALDREIEGDVCLHDLGQGLPFRPGTFDGAISISAVQWLCNADASSHDPRRRLRRFFETLYSCLAKGARAVLQIYPENTEQASMMTNAAMRAGFSGGLVVDYPHSTRAKKYFLVLMVGGTASLPQARDGEEPQEGEEGEHVRISERRSKRRKGARDGGSRRGWIVRKKSQQRTRGYSNIKPDTKYTGRKRKDRF
jgi:18S rRNA (guanine1575-N7)-methyltransferase